MLLQSHLRYPKVCPEPHFSEYYRKDPELLSNGLAVHLPPEDVLHGKGCVVCGPH